MDNNLLSSPDEGYEQPYVKNFKGPKERYRALKEFEIRLKDKKIKEQERKLEEKDRYIRELEEEIIRDPLTDLPNRERMYNKVVEELERSHRNNSDLSLMMMDLDDFKHVNDELGHQAGDRYLQGIADSIEDVTREYDASTQVTSQQEKEALHRYGGDEFLVVLPETSSEEAIKVAERIEDSVLSYINSLNLEEEGVEGEQGITIGISTYDPDEYEVPKDKTVSEERAEELIRRADEEMYHKKKR